MGNYHVRFGGRERRVLIEARPSRPNAELSSAMLGAELGLPVTHLDSHASYIEHWLKLLKDDDRAILTAAAKAEEASTLLLKLGGRVMPEQFDNASDGAALAA